MLLTTLLMQVIAPITSTPPTKKSNKEDTRDKKLSDYTNQLSVLTDKNWIEFKMELDHLIYWAGWPEKLLDVKGKHEAVPWHGEEEKDAVFCKMRRDAFAVLRMQLHSTLKHLLVGLRPGDAKGLFFRLK